MEWSSSSTTGEGGTEERWVWGEGEEGAGKAEAGEEGAEGAGSAGMAQKQLGVRVRLCKRHKLLPANGVIKLFYDR